MSTNISINQRTPEAYNPSSVTLTLAIVLLIFFFVGFFSIYLCKCFMEHIASTRSSLGRNPSGNAVPQASETNHGLDPSIISSFPTFVYSTVKDLQQDKYGLECAVCLSEFEDDDTLRLLTECNHVFHPECIDLWLGNHTTCPVCRVNLDPSHKSPEKSPDITSTALAEMEQQQDVDSMVDREGEQEERGQSHDDASSRMSQKIDGHETMIEKFSRCHSTGHSIIHIEEVDDRFSLRLPEIVKEHLARGHNWTGSCIVFEDFSADVATENGGLAEQSEFSRRELSTTV
ncbi:PREDICTED: RING-H2 finger protein ATL29 [Nelumbo nucifera]|uniref:RING-type E3 ubiquitin transferase n=2 Tax=Nelumbo nucifera TaxID=4432 RepID=A0A1U8B9X2_NELNU|nr:PREDICTED: RING-H2 finger protein ATL29 [Nelumbo nucifera]DAD47475.1 TPA_asm: hypothetical protein HUJ06_017412 [Nelumbo nucifera]